jgi:hypothetical protein
LPAEPSEPIFTIAGAPASSLPVSGGRRLLASTERERIAF